MRSVRILAAAGAVLATLVLSAGGAAIGNGVPDGNNHPNVGLLTVGFQEGGTVVRFPVCSGSYGGPRTGQPAQEVFITAAHCLAWMPAEGIAANQLWVTFDSAVTFDPNTTQVTSANTWHRASAFAFDPAFAQTFANAHDYGVVLLDSVPAGLPPVQLPTAGLLDQLAAKGGLRHGTVFDNVGYGVIPIHKKGPPRFALPTGRMFSTSRFMALTQAYLKLNMNSDIQGNGGVCYGDSGSPKFIHGTNTAVAITFGGDPICRALNYNSRLDIPAARAFYGQYLALP